jgi:hypothetical protein
VGSIWRAAGQRTAIDPPTSVTTPYPFPELDEVVETLESQPHRGLLGPPLFSGQVDDKHHFEFYAWLDTLKAEAERRGIPLRLNTGANYAERGWYDLWIEERP